MLADCLQSVFSFTSGIVLEIIVVDNHSQDNSRELIAAQFPYVKWIQQDYNSGFARGNNAGIKQAAGDAVLLLNSDTIIEDNAIADCYKRLMSSDYIAGGVQLLNGDKTPQITGNYFMTGGLNHLLQLPYAGRIFRTVALLLRVKKTNIPEAKNLVEVDWINGAFLMVKRSAIEQAGLLDEDFFLYSEEIEWCSRLRKTGKICVYGDLHVIHLQGITAHTTFGAATAGYQDLTDRKGLQLLLSGLVRMRKQFGTGWFLFHLLAYLLTIPVYFLVATVQMLLRRPEWKSWWGFTKNVCRVCSYVPVIIRNKPFFYKVL